MKACIFVNTMMSGTRIKTYSGGNENVFCEDNLLGLNDEEVD